MYLCHRLFDEKVKFILLTEMFRFCSPCYILISDFILTAFVCHIAIVYRKTTSNVSQRNIHAIHFRIIELCNVLFTASSKGRKKGNNMFVLSASVHNFGIL